MFISNRFEMRIAIDLTALFNRKWTGVELYAVDLYKALLTTGYEIIPIFHVKNEIDNNQNAYIIPKRNRLWLENISLSYAIRQIKADLVCFPIFAPPIDVYCIKRMKVVPTVHDLAFMTCYKAVNPVAKYYLVPKRKLSLKKSDAIITISETERKQISAITDIPVYDCGENISIDYKNCEKKADISFLTNWNLSSNDYYISVSTIEPRKNFKYLLKIMSPVLESTGKKLVLVGRRGWGDDKELEHLINGMGNSLVFTEYISANCLVSLYRYAYAFILMSLDEGFGRTPFEAVACGCRRVILSKIPIFRETFRNDSLFLPLNKEDECKKILLKENIPLVSEEFDIPFDVMEKRIGRVLDNIIAL